VETPFVRFVGRNEAVDLGEKGGGRQRAGKGLAGWPAKPRHSFLAGEEGTTYREP